MEPLTTLKDRERYLAGRAALKREIGWEFQYDERERAALQSVIEENNRLREIERVAREVVEFMHWHTTALVGPRWVPHAGNKLADLLE